MDFTDLYKYTLLSLSKDNNFFSYFYDSKLIIKSTQDLCVTQCMQLSFIPDSVEWSPDSAFILLFSKKLARIEVRSLESTKFLAHLENSSYTHVKWASDSRHIFMSINFSSRIEVMNVLTRDKYLLENPKFGSFDKGFKQYGRYLAVLERNDAKDILSIYDVQEWSCHKSIYLDSTDSADLAFSKDGRFIFVWESIVNSKIYIYDLNGKFVKDFSLAEPIKKIDFSDHFCAICTASTNVYLLSTTSWCLFSEIDFNSEITYNIFMEKAGNGEDDLPSYEVDTAPTIPNVKEEPKSPDLAFSQDDLFPSCVWIYCILKCQFVSLVVNKSIIKSFEWKFAEEEHRLAIISRNSKFLYFWTPSGAEITVVPSKSRN